MPKISWPTATIVVVLCASYVTLDVTGHAIPSWLAGVSGAIIAGLFPGLFPPKSEAT